jgi:hypothetical protein
MQLPKSRRRIVFYSEGKSNWPHLESLLRSFLILSDIPVCYITSGLDDPAFEVDHPNLTIFYLDEGFLRNWLFSNIDTDVMIMTMPDLDNFQVKRSRYPVHYVYVHHALVSCHMVYRPGAFDHFDTIFCAGPHHVDEIRALEKLHQLKPKKLVEHGYGRLDAILANAQSHSIMPEPKHILIAPSWGKHGMIETIGDQVIGQLLNHGYKVTLRPHPQTVKFSSAILKKIKEKYASNLLFSFETNMADQSSLHLSSLMISDWSGAALDYAFGLGKPVLFLDIERKINNPRYTDLAIVPFEDFIRERIGEIVPLDKLNALTEYVERLLINNHLVEKMTIMRESHVFNIHQSGQKGARALLEILT